MCRAQTGVVPCHTSAGAAKKLEKEIDAYLRNFPDLDKKDIHEILKPITPEEAEKRRVSNV